MDRKTILIFGACLLLLLMWPKLVNTVFPPTPLPPGQNNEVAAAASNTNIPAVAPTIPATPAAPGAASAVTGLLGAAGSNLPEQLLVLTNDNARYVFTSHGGGLKEVELRHFPESVSPLRKKKVTEIKSMVALNDSAPVAIGSLLEAGGVADDNGYTLTSPSANSFRAERVLPNGLTLIKEFTLETNYLVNAVVRLENRGTEALTLPARELVVGTATPLGPQDKGQFVGVGWYDGQKEDRSATAAYFANRKFGCVPGTPLTEFRRGQSNVVWVAAHNQFFTLVAMPSAPAPEVVVRPIVLPVDTDAPTNTAASKGYQAALSYPATALAPGQSIEEQLELFAGPKEYRTLASIAARFNNNADLVMGYSGFFGGFARVLLLAMNWLHDAVRLPYGWAIITITFIIKMTFWPLTRASTRSMKRMSALQPQMKAIQEKYKDDPAKMNKKTMEFMREHKLNPVGGCLPMLIQLPIFIGFYRMIQSAIELRGAPFLWIGDLANPDTLFIIHGMGFVPFIGIPGVGLPVNLLPLIMGATQIWQMRLTPPSPGVDPAQQRIMKYMPLMFIVILYNFSAGLTLYWTMQNLLTILQTKLTKNNPNDPLLAPHPGRAK